MVDELRQKVLELREQLEQEQARNKQVHDLNKICIMINKFVAFLCHESALLAG